MISKINNSNLTFNATPQNIKKMASRMTCACDGEYYETLAKRFENIEKIMTEKNIDTLTINLNKPSSEIPKALEDAHLSKQMTLADFDKNTGLKATIQSSLEKYRLPHPTQIDLNQKTSKSFFNRLFAFIKGNN